MHFLSSLFLIPAFYVIFNINTSAQSGIYISGMGSVNYIPKKNFAHSLNASPIKDINELGLNGSAGISFVESENNIFILSVEYIRSDASFSWEPIGSLSGKWDFRVIPVSFGYQYLFSEPGNRLKPFAGVNISYSFIKIEYNSSFSDYNKIFNINRFGIEPNFGFLYGLSEIFSFITEIRYRYLEDINLNLYQDVNLSGLSGSIGVQVKVL